MHLTSRWFRITLYALSGALCGCAAAANDANTRLQAIYTSYLGEDAILKARAQAEKTLGSRFNVRAFHDTILELGSVPLPVLAARIDRFVADGGAGPYPELE